MNVLQHTRNERNLCLKQNRPDRSYRDTLLSTRKEQTRKMLTRETEVVRFVVFDITEIVVLK